MTNTYDPEKERPEKKIVRDKIFDIISPEEIAQNIALFPGEKCVDLEQGLRTHKFSKDSRYFLFERNIKSANIINERCKQLGLKNFTIVTKDFGKFGKDANDSIYTEIYDTDFDFMFLDSCGELTYEFRDTLELFFGEKNKNITRRRIAMTFCAQDCFKQNDFYKNHPTYRKNFTLPPGSMGLMKENPHKAFWSCDMALKALGLDSRALVKFFFYKDSATMPMVTFAIDTKRERTKTIKQISKTVNKELNTEIDINKLAIKYGEMIYDKLSKKEKEDGKKALRFLITKSCNSNEAKNYLLRITKENMMAVNQDVSFPVGKRAQAKKSFNLLSKMKCK